MKGQPRALTTKGFSVILIFVKVLGQQTPAHSHLLGNEWGQETGRQ